MSVGRSAEKLLVAVTLGLTVLLVACGGGMDLRLRPKTRRPAAILPESQRLVQGSACLIRRTTRGNFSR